MMTPTELLLSVACSAVVCIALALLGVIGRRSFLPDWHGSAAWTGGIAMALCTAVVLGQALGAVGALNRWSVVSALVVCAAAATLVERRWGRPTAETVDSRPAVLSAPAMSPAVSYAAAEGPTVGSPPAPGVGTLMATEPIVGVGPVVTGVVALAVLVVAALWAARTVIVLREGIVDPDTLGYHLPFTFAFARDGHANAQLLPIPGFGVSTFPANDELVAAMALVVSHSVVFTAVKNLLFAGAAIVAAHAIGTRARAGLAAAAAAAAALGAPVAAFTIAGTGKNDAIALLAVLLGVSCLVLARGRTAPLVLASACGGIAVGTKLSSVVAGAVIVVAALVMALRRSEGRRWGSTVPVLGAGLATGAPWYIRNAVTYRNPLPLVRLSLGPIRLRAIPAVLEKNSLSVAHFLVRGQDLGILVRGLKEAMGPVGLLLVLASVAGVAVGTRAGGWRRWLALFGALLVLAYLTTPASAYVAPDGRPVQYAVALNMHYALPAGAVCLIVLAISLPPRLAAGGISVVGLAVTLAGLRTGLALSFWAPHLGSKGFALLLVAAGAGALAIGLRHAGHIRWRPAAALAVALAVVGVAAAAASRPSQRSEDPVVRYLASAGPMRIVTDAAYLGTLYGPGGRNQVILQVSDVGGVLTYAATCPSWMSAVVGHRASEVAVAPAGVTHDWVAADPAFVLVAANPLVQLYAVKGVPGSHCPSPG
jgi:hypothetical protein